MTAQRTINLPPKAVISECGPILTALKRHTQAEPAVLVRTPEKKAIRLISSKDKKPTGGFDFHLHGSSDELDYSFRPRSAG